MAQYRVINSSPYTPTPKWGLYKYQHVADGKRMGQITLNPMDGELVKHYGSKLGALADMCKLGYTMTALNQHQFRAIPKEER